MSNELRDKGNFLVPCSCMSNYTFHTNKFLVLKILVSPVLTDLRWLNGTALRFFDMTGLEILFWRLIYSFDVSLDVQNFRSLEQNFRSLVHLLAYLRL
jgi:hypothetical protein